MTTLRKPIPHHALRFLLPLILALAAALAPAQAAIPAAERAVLTALYSATNGAGWTNKTNWNGAAGTECTWWGVTCDAGQAHVIAIKLVANNLSGTLPSINALSALERFEVFENRLGGTIPPFTGMNSLSLIDLDSNQLTGSLPPLAVLPGLKYFYAWGNQLTGEIPPLAGMSGLVDFDVAENQLSGPIPPLDGLTSLQWLNLYSNQFSGPIPSLAGLSALEYFIGSNNQLSGAIPPLTGLSKLKLFFVHGNQLTGTLPALAGLANLEEFVASRNQLTGALPALAGLTKLKLFLAGVNGLTGPIPALTGLAALETFDVHANQLSGPIPPLAGLPALKVFWVADNQLSGPMPAASNSALTAGGSTLCGNALSSNGNSAVDAAWSAAQSPQFAAGGQWLNCQGPMTQNFSDSWWNADESGWGVTLTHHSSNIFLQWYTYDQTGHNQKFVISGGTFSNGKCVFSGTLQRVTGPSWLAPGFDPGQVIRTSVGTATLDFCPQGWPAGTIVFHYVADGIAGFKPLSRLSFGNDVPHQGGSANTGGPDFTDLWWNPAESGWGVSVTQHGNNLFFRIFVYDTDNRPLLFVVPGVTVNSPTSFSGALQLTSGPWYGSSPFDPDQVVRTTAGSASLNFGDANNGVLTYTVNGVTRSKAITRLVF
jgi:hypothetical protein